MVMWFFLLLTAAAHGQSLAPGGDAWSPQAYALLEDYRQGRYALVQQECSRLLASTSDERIRRDLRALAAMTLLRGESREDRTSGRAMLAALEQEDGAFGRRPECLLAMGVGLVGLSETGGALDNLDRAVERFIAQGETTRATAAMAELAAGWAAHMEWELTPRRFGLSLPDSPEQASTIRLDRIRATRDLAAALPNAERALRRIDLVLASTLIESAGDVAGGVEILERLVEPSAIDAPAAAALERLGSIYAGHRRWEDAVLAYRRLEAAELGDASYRAGGAADEIVEPSVALDVPAAVIADNSTPVAVTTRNVESVSLEIRRFDLTGWLESHQGRLVDGQLPDNGALVVPAKRLGTAVAKPHDVWRSRDAGEPMSFDLPKGVYVGIARARSPDGREQVDQKLLVVGGLRAAAFIGEGQVLVWAVGGGEPARDATASFWMNGGTFVAPSRQLVDGIVRFPLPPEARLARDKRWACVVRSGEDVALCRGTLSPEAVEPSNRPTVILQTNGLNFRVGDTLELQGMLLAPRHESSPTPAAPPPNELVLEFVDTDGRTVAAPRCAVSKLGAFQVSLPISNVMTGKALHTVVRDRGTVVPNVDRQAKFNVEDGRRGELRARLRLPLVIDAASRTVKGELIACYPGGIPARDVDVQLMLHGLELPAAGQGGFPTPLEPQGVLQQLDRDGRMAFSFPFGGMGLQGQWAVFEVFADIKGWDDATTFVRSFVEVSPGAAPIPGVADRALPGAAVESPRIVAVAREEGIRVELSSEARGPSLVLLDDGAPRAAHALADGERGPVLLTAASLRAASAQVLLFEMTDNGLELVESADVAFESAGTLSIAAAPPALAPEDGRLAVRLALEGAPSDAQGCAVVRLVDLTPRGLEDVWSGYGSHPVRHTTALQIASSDGAGVADDEQNARNLSRSFREAMLEGANVAIAGGALSDGAVELSLPIPDSPGRYQIVAAVRLADGRYVTARAPVDVGDVVRTGLYVPDALRLGDRSEAVVELERIDGEPVSRSVDVRIDIGDRLARTAASPDSATQPDRRDEFGRTRFEAVAVGAGQAVAEVELEEDASRVRAAYCVYPDVGRGAARAVGRFVESTLSAGDGGSPGWTPGSRTRLIVQGSVAHVAVDAACEWLSEPVESTAWHVSRLVWADVLLALRPEWAERPLAQLLNDLELDTFGQERLESEGLLTLAAFRGLALDALLLSQRRDGGWGRWQEDSPGAAATAWAVDALETVLDGLTPALDAYRTEDGIEQEPRAVDALRRGRSWLEGALSSSTSFEDSASCLFGLSRTAAADPALLTKWSGVADRLRRASDHLDSRRRCLLAAALRRNGRTREADGLMTFAVEGGLGSTWIAIGRLDALDDASARGEAEDLLLASRTGTNGWGEPIATAWALRALAVGALPRGDPSATGRVVVETPGTESAEVVMADEPSVRRLDLAATPSLTLRHQGQGRPSALWVGVGVSASPRSAVRVSRELVLLRVERVEGRKVFRESATYDGEAVPVGQYILVKETWEFPDALGPAEWTQPLPAGCIPWRGPGTPVASIGTLERRDRRILCWTAPCWQPGTSRREYVLIAAGPGALLFPDPELRVEGRHVPVESASGRLRLTVTSPP